MRAKIEFTFRPFQVPNYAITERNSLSGMDEVSIPLQVLDSETFDRLCDDFRSAVFKKAGKPQPPTQG